MTPAEYKAEVGARRRQPEHKLQVEVCKLLMWAVPPSIAWTASAAGVYVSPSVSGRMKAAGVRKGWPDLQFLFPDGVTRYVELKAKGGSLTPEQRDFALLCKPHNIFAVCRSVDEVEHTLRAWGADLKSRPFRIVDTAA